MLRVTVLGCGTSAGVPLIGCTCAVCTSGDPRNSRRRCSILVETAATKVLVDTGPDMRAQCLDAGVSRIDAILYTHAHADHVHGIDDVRSLNFLMGRPIDAYAHADVFRRIRARFDYAFQPPGDDGWWRPSLNPIEVDGPFRVGDLDVVPVEQLHGKLPAWGFRFGVFAYSPDVNHLPEEAFAALEGVRVWIVEGLRDAPHPSHAHIGLALEWIERLRPELAILTHMNHEVEYTELRDRLPPGVVPAYDGMVLEV
jgi:phosphoribosyl 1,2-cyclic phosphate phosphodiesterase